MSKLNLRIFVLAALSATLVGGLLAAQKANAATRTWNGTSGTNWSTGSNWSGGSIPGTGDTALFNEQGEAGAANTVTNLVDFSFPQTGGVSTIADLQYLIDTGTTPEFYHRTAITAGRTLLATDQWQVNSLAGSNIGTIHLEMAGGAGSKFQVGNTGTTTANVILGNHGVASKTLTLDIDLTGLENFEANVDTFKVSDTSRPVNGTFQLAQNNHLRGNLFRTGLGTGNNAGLTQTLLGQTNTLEFDTLDIAIGKSVTTVEFNTGLTNPTLTIRGTAGGGSRADLNLGITTIGTNTSQDGILDLSAGIVNAMIDTFTIAKATASGTTKGTFTMSAGNLDANNLLVASGTVGRSSIGTLNIQGGSFSASTATLGQRSDGGSSDTATLNISGGDVTFGTLLLGDKTGIDAGTAKGIVNLSDGSLTAGSITKGAGIAVLNFTGGRLTTDSMNFDLLQQGGTLATKTGSTNITGDYDLQAAGTLEVTLTTTMSPALIVTGNIALAGELDVLPEMFEDFLNPVSSLDIITATGGITGEFSNAPNGTELKMNGLIFNISYSGNAVTLTNIVADVPEPTSLTLLGLGLFALVRRRRRASKC